MSNKQETIADIVAEMTECADRIEKRGLYDLRECGTDYLRALADLIEAEHKREREAGAEAAQICGEIGELIGRDAARDETVTDCNHFGNAERMREALVKSDAAFSRISQSDWFIDANFSETKEVMDAGNAIEEALSAPPRNCDRFSNANEALEAFEKETGETMIEFIRWLFAEAKGVTDGSK